MRSVTVDLAAGVICFGPTRILMQSHGANWLAPDGTSLRTISFSERSRAVAAALVDDKPEQVLIKELRSCANHAHPCTELIDAIVVALAGGAEVAPSFEECALTACRFSSLDWTAVQDSAALLIDRLAVSSAAAQVDDSWTRFEFRPALDSEISIGDHCKQMLQRLLTRGRRTSVEQEVLNVTNSPRHVRPAVRQKNFPLPPNEAELRDVTPPVDLVSKAGEKLSRRASAKWIQNVQQATVDSALYSGDPAPARVQESPIANSATAANTALDRPASGHGLGTSSRLVAAGSHAVTGPVTPSAATSPARPARARIRSHRLVLPLVKTEDTSSATVVPMEKSATTSLMFSDVPPAVKPQPQNDQPAKALQRDWLYEIAAALAAECDLRGFDA